LNLDEINLAEPEILERLNPLLETPRTWRLTENGGEIIQVPSTFRLFATMNPAEYAGRRRLSPAFLDRFIGHVVVPGRTAQDYAAHLTQWVYGEAPVVEVAGRSWTGRRVEPLLKNLARCTDIEEMIPLIAHFHALAETAAEGTDGRAPSRRALFRVASFADQGSASRQCRAAFGRAVERYYLARLPASERAGTADLAAALNLGAS
jgi:MoxR-like ATPase